MGNILLFHLQCQDASFLLPCIWGSTHANTKYFKTELFLDSILGFTPKHHICTHKFKHKNINFQYLVFLKIGVEVGILILVALSPGSLGWDNKTVSQQMRTVMGGDACV